MKRIEHREKEWQFPFVEYSPEERAENLPIIIQLHGAGERGEGKDDLSLVDVHGFSKTIKDADYPCIFIMPQCPSDSFWAAKIESIIAFTEKLIKEQNLLKNPVLIIQFEHSSVNENLTGLIANQIAAKYNRPTLILNEVYVDGARYWRGSGRNVKGTKFANFQQFLMDSHLVEYAAGHDNALGVSIYDIQMPAFKNYCATHVDESQFAPVYKVDLEFDAGEIDGLDILSLGDLKPIWGEGVEEPKIFVKNLKVNTSNLDLLKGSTIKITPVNREDNLSYIMFKAEEGVYDMLNTNGVITLNIVGTCARNDYNGQPQIIIQDFEITQRQNYYF